MKVKNLDELKLELKELNQKIEDKRLEIKRLENIEYKINEIRDKNNIVEIK